MSSKPRQPDRRGRFPRVAVCFHDPEPSGASLWLQRFLLNGGLPRESAVAVFPARSPMESALTDSGIACRTLRIRMGSISRSSLRARLALLGNRISSISQYRQLFRREKIRAVYVNSSYQIAPVIAARLCGLPLFVHVREGASTGRSHGLKRWIVRHLAQTAAFDALAGMELFGPPLPGRTWEVSPNGVQRDFAALRKNRDSIRDGLGVGPEDRVLLFLGTLCERKGLHDLLAIWPRIYKEFPQAHLLVAGGVDPSDQNPAIRNFPANPPQGSRYLGFRSDAAELIAAADFLVLPSYGEAMPISISEAMMIGTPVIARAVGDVAWQIGGGRGFLFAEKGHKIVYTTICKALESADGADQRARAAKDFAEKNLDQRTQYRQIRRLIFEACRIRKRREG